MSRHRQRRNQRGFTIVELMIATAVLSVLLLLVSVILNNIGNLFYKGFNQARIQDDARSIAGQLSQDLELNGGAVLSSTVLSAGGQVQSGAYCINNVRYSYIIGKKISPSTGIPHVLWRDANPVSGTCTSADLSMPTPSSDGVELIAPDSRLSKFTTTLSSPYTVSIAIAYGDDDLLCSPSAPPPPSNTCASAATMPAADFLDGDLTCKTQIGDSYCATADLTTTVLQRVQ